MAHSFSICAAASSLAYVSIHRWYKALEEPLQSNEVQSHDKAKRKATCQQ